MAILTTHNLAVGYRGKKGCDTTVLKGLNLSLDTGRMAALLGRNGAGKSTLLRALTCADKPLAGSIEIAGRDVTKYGKHELAKLLGLVSTDRVAVGGLTVSELVAMGRQPHTGFLGRLDDDDRQVVADAIASVGMEHKADTFVAQLSDGERQKAMIAKALAQQTPVIVLDEPTAFLDVASRVETMELLHHLARDQHKAVLLSSHDISQSLLLADDLWVVCNDGSVVAGSTETVVMDSDAMNRMFGSQALAFNASLYDFEPKIATYMSVKLECDNEALRRCMTNALLRNGIGVNDAAKVTVVANSLSQIAINGEKCGSVEQMLAKLKR